MTTEERRERIVRLLRDVLARIEPVGTDVVGWARTVDELERATLLASLCHVEVAAAWIRPAEEGQ